jgi:hypothetical protein
LAKRKTYGKNIMPTTLFSFSISLFWDFDFGQKTHKFTCHQKDIIVCSLAACAKNDSCRAFTNIEVEFIPFFIEAGLV